MATLQALRIGGLPNSVRLSAAQAGNGVSTNVCDTGNNTGPVALLITTAIGATPTCTYAIEGSVDLTNWYPIPYADAGTPDTNSVATFVITTAGLVVKYIKAGYPWRYIRLTYSANTNVTNTVDAWNF